MQQITKDNGITRQPAMSHAQSRIFPGTCAKALAVDETHLKGLESTLTSKSSFDVRMV